MHSKRPMEPAKAAAGAALFALAALAPLPALSQTPTVPAAPAKPGTPHAIPEKVDEPLRSGRSESLSDRLDESKGVIKPKAGVDPGIVQPAPVPHPNSTPVIPPPPGPVAK